MPGGAASVARLSVVVSGPQMRHHDETSGIRADTCLSIELLAICIGRSPRDAEAIASNLDSVIRSLCWSDIRCTLVVSLTAPPSGMGLT